MSGNLCKDCLEVIEVLEKKEDTSKKSEKKRKEKKNDKKNKLNIKSLKEQIDEVVMGQNEAKEQMVVEFYKHYKGLSSPANNIFIVGDSGVGKTFLVRSLSKLLDLPFIEVDATSYTEAGYKGNDVTEIIDELIVREKGNRRRIEQSIVFIDEIDKTTTTTSSTASPNKVQQSLLKMIEGMEYSYEISTGKGVLEGVIDTSKIMFIAAGACVGLTDIRKKRLKPNDNRIGFASKPIKEKEFEDRAIADYISQDLIDFGFIPEFIGRYSLIVELQPLTEENIKDILVNSPNSILKGALEMFEEEGVELVIDKTDVDWLMKESTNNPLGVRSLNQSLLKHLNDRLFQSITQELNSIQLSLAKSNQKKKIR